ncbi:MAG: 16S rRNA (uracil(1498)-N(3))-methyltransferase [Xanthomonadales bacterium]|nr:16S rRNA (uracil(1498)-N(3))-methyltransferase [Xanthomonadales bacterium]
MRTIRCHVDAPLEPGSMVGLPEQARAHLQRVLRLRAGDAVVLFNGDGSDYPAELSGAGDRLAASILGRAPPTAPEAGLELVLVQALARGEKMDWIIQKATELGVARIVPVVSVRSEVRLAGDRLDKRLVHWRRVASSACEQCGRARVPDIVAPQALHEVADAGLATTRLVLHPDTQAGLPALALRSSVAVAVGPEGGFDDIELAQLLRAGWLATRLGDRILRTETAGLVAGAALLALAGEFGPDRPAQG